MKKLFSALLVMTILASILCIPVFAADPPEKDGIYGVTIEPAYQSAVTVVAQDENGAEVSGAVVSINDKSETLYAEAVKLKITITGLDEGYYLILGQNGENSTDVPTESNIVYIDQATAASGSVTFTVYPEKLDEGTTYYVKLSSSASASALVLSFKYYSSYILGDADLDKVISANDALVVLQAVAHLKTLTGNAALAANADKDEVISANDALYILQAVAHLRTLTK